MIWMIWMIILRQAPRRGPLGQPGGTSGRPPASLTSRMLKTLRFPLLSRPTGHPCPLPENSCRLPRNGQNVYISWEKSMFAQIMCSRLQPQPHYARGTVQNHPTDHPTCFSPLAKLFPRPVATPVCHTVFVLNRGEKQVG